MRPHDPVGAEIERLLGLPLRLLVAVRRNAHHRGDRRRHRAGLGDLAAVEHVLEASRSERDVIRAVLHLVDDAVVFRRRHGDRGLHVGRRERREGGLARFQRPDHAVQSRQFGHSSLSFTPLLDQSMLQSSCRPRERGDPYAVSSRWTGGLGPAFAGTTRRIVLSSRRQPLLDLRLEPAVHFQDVGLEDLLACPSALRLGVWSM